MSTLIIKIDGVEYPIRQTPPLYIPPAPYHVQKGIDLFNAGEPMPQRPTCVGNDRDSQDLCDIRHGWIIGQADARRAAACVPDQAYGTYPDDRK